MSDDFSNIKPGDKLLVTCDSWFFAPDGLSYRAVYGTVRAAHTAEASLGIRPNGKSTNWYLEIGNMILAGCQIHYFVKTDTCVSGPVVQWNTHEGKIVKDLVPSQIYFAD